MTAYPVWQGLAKGRFGKGIVGCPHHADKDLHLPDLAGMTVGDRHGLPAIVHEALLARQMFLTHDGIELASPFAIVLAEPAIAKSIWLGNLIFLPQQI